MNAISIGEVLWDVVGAKEHLGGATFNFSANLARLGHQVSFISAVGKDERGQRILERMVQMGLSTRYVHQTPDHATGIVTVTLSEGGQPHFVLHRPAAYDFPTLSEQQLAELSSQKTDCIYFGTLLNISAQAKSLTLKLLDSLAASRRFYDVNLRPEAYSPELVRELMARATVVKLNDDEVREIARMEGRQAGSLEEFCRRHAGEFGWEAVCVTCGPRGCALLLDQLYVEAPGYNIKTADTVGAGDAFAAAFLHGLSSRWPAAKIADFANRVGALVAGRVGAVPAWSVEEALALQPARSHRKVNQRETA